MDWLNELAYRTKNNMFVEENVVSISLDKYLRTPMSLRFNSNKIIVDGFVVKNRFGSIDLNIGRYLEKYDGLKEEYSKEL